MITEHRKRQVKVLRVDIFIFTMLENGRRRIDIVANEVGVSESVLIAGVDMYDGPSKTLWILDIDDPQYDGLDLLSHDSKIWIEDDGTIAELNNATQRKNILDTTPLRFTAKIFKFR